MGSPSFAKPEFSCGIAVSYSADDYDLYEIAQAHELESNEYIDVIEMAESIAYEIADDDMNHVSRTIEGLLERAKSIIDSELSYIMPDAHLFEDEFVSYWFEIEKIHGYNGDAIGFVLQPDQISFRRDYDFALAYWENRDTRYETVTLPELVEFFEKLEAYYDYMMLAVGHRYNLYQINGGWCGCISPITEAPTVPDGLKDTDTLSKFNELLDKHLDLV